MSLAVGAFLLGRSSGTDEATPVSTTTSPTEHAACLAKRSCALANGPDVRMAQAGREARVIGQLASRALGEAEVEAGTAARLDPQWDDLLTVIHDWKTAMRRVSTGDIEAWNSVADAVIRSFTIECTKAGWDRETSADDLAS